MWLHTWKGQAHQTARPGSVDTLLGQVTRPESLQQWCPACQWQVGSEASSLLCDVRVQRSDLHSG